MDHHRLIFGIILIMGMLKGITCVLTRASPPDPATSPPVSEGETVFPQTVQTFTVGSVVGPGAITWSITSTTDCPTTLFSVIWTAATTGVLRLMAAPDYETKTQHNCIIKADDGANGAVTWNDFRIPVTNVIEKPTFPAGNNYACTIDEESSAGTLVTTCKIDFSVDGGDDPQCSISGTNADMFTVQTDKTNNKCSLKVASKFDRDKIPESIPGEILNLEVRVTGNSGQFVEESVTVTINDINDNAPACNPKIRNYFVNENVNINFQPVSCTDPDKNARGQIEYFIVNGNTGSKFTLNKDSGDLTSTALDYDVVSPNYKLVIHAIDKAAGTKQTTTVTVNIIVKPINEHAPVWGTWIPAVPGTATDSISTISEHATPGTQAFQAKATDDDFGVDGLITYRLTSVTGDDGTDLSASFSIDSEGNVRKQGSTLLDMEKYQKIEFSVRAEDRDSAVHFVTQNVIVSVEDVNEFPPKFENLLTTTSINEKKPAATEIYDFKSKLTDEDFTSPLVAVCEIVGGDLPTKFKITDKTKVVLAVVGPDPDSPTLEPNKYELVIECRDLDGGAGSLPARSTLQIDITSNNNYPPTIISPVTKLEFAEDHPTGKIVELTPGDKDRGVGEKYTCTLAPASGPFRVSSDCSSILQVSAFDYETTKSYSVIVKINDGDNEVTMDTIEVTITDVNDNYPVCTQKLSTATLYEDAAADTEIGTIVCDDKDETADPKAVLELLNENSLPFKLDPDTGKVTVKTGTDILDYDAVSAVTKYDLIIRATDKRSLTMFVDSFIKVTILPVEDNAPTLPATSTVQLPENTPPGAFVTAFTGTDGDKAPHNIQGYELIKASNGGLAKFILDPTGKVRVSAGTTFDYDTLVDKKFVLEITATDGTNTVTGSVTVEITDINDNAPILSQSVYTGTIAESAATGAETGVTLAATDADEDDTAAIFAKIAGSGDPNNYFEVDATSGKVTRTATAGPIDYDTEKLITFKVKATDRTTGSILSTESHVIINVVDSNQNTPTCTGSPKITKDFLENTALGTVVQKFSDICSDVDTSQSLVYSIVTANDHFTLNTANGEVILTKAMDVEDSTTKPYSMVVKVSDNHGTPKSIDMTLEITPKNVDEEPPKCTTVPSSVSIKEDAATGDTAFTLVGCTDHDSSTLKYSIPTVDGTPGSGPFTIDASGVGKVGSVRLNYETKTSYALKVLVEDATSSPALYSTSYDILVNILPVNEFPPVNAIASATGTVREETAVGNTITISPVLAATDADKGSNHGAIHWEIVGGNDDGYFSMSRDGTIKIAKPLDYEDKQTIVLEVQAKDGPGLGSTKQDVSISITDYNDNTPKFSAVHSTVNIRAGTAAPSNLLDFSSIVSDADSTVNSAFEMSFATYTGSEFQWDTTKKILQTKNVLTTPSQYTVVVLATNKGDNSVDLTGTATVTVNVLENNANPPIFTGGGDTTIPENFPIGGVIVDASATDADPGTNGKITYSITTDTSGGKFVINPDTGEVLLKEFLDKETSPGPYSLTITGTDTGGKTGTVSYNLIIEDVNDNDPEFQAVPNNNFDITIHENYNSSDGHFNVIKWSDKDANGAQDVKCFIKSQSGSGDRFDIDPNTCIMFVKNPVDRESVEIYNVLVELRDTGMTPVRSSEAMFKITLSDQNDNSPDFGSQSGGISATIFENIAIGTQIATVQAKDRDKGANAAISYSLTGALAGFFSIDSAGVITNAQVIDAETYQTMTFDAVATDGGNSPRSSSIPVKLTILDVDDHVPIITGSPYDVDLPENAGNWTLLTTIQAADGDITYNVLSYSIIAGDTFSLFKVNTEGKVFYVTGALDRETYPSFDLTIEVSDNAPTPNKVNAIVRITITDINDNAPRLLPPIDVHQSISENSPVDSPVPLGANVTDDDAGPNNNRLTYSLDAVISGPDYFKIDATTGLISIKTAKLDREAKDEYILRIKVRDNGIPSLSVSYTVTITLLDENDNTPIFLLNPYTATIPEDTAVGTNFLTVGATDLDINENANLTYFIKSGFPTASSLFSVDSVSGVLSVNGILDYETIKVHVFQLIAVDAGAPSRTGSTTVTVSLTDVNDVKPTVSPAFLSSEVPLADNGDMLIATVGHTDPDTGVGGEATYAWRSATIHFTIDTNTGIIRRNVAYQLVVDSIYVEYVEATDKGTPSLTSTSAGTVRIDTFAVEEYTVIIYFAASLQKFYDNLNSIKTGLSLVLSNKYPDNRVGMWTAVQQGSETKAYFYGVQSRDTDKIENIEQEKKFIPRSDLLAYWRFDSSGQPTAALQTFHFVNASVTLVEPYPQGASIAWFQTAGAIAGLVIGALALAALLAGLIALIVLKCGGPCAPCPTCPPCCPPGNSSANYAPGQAAKPAAKPAPVKPTRELLQLNKDKHPKKVENISGEDTQDPRPRSSNKTKIVDQDIDDNIFDPNQGELRQYEAPVF